MPPRARATSGAPLGAPLFLLNLKAYPGCLGPDALRLGRLLERAGRESGVAVAIAPAPTDVGLLARFLSLPVLAQHTDPVEAGAHTGAVAAEAVAASGARGSLVNHSEHRVPLAEAGQIVARLVGIGLVPVVCARDIPDARRLAAYRPPYLAVEPPELIGGSRAVSTTRPEVVAGTVTAVEQRSPRTRVLCGAGVHDATDVRRALELGSSGVLVASAVTRSPQPGVAIRELLRGFR